MFRWCCCRRVAKDTASTAPQAGEKNNDRKGLFQRMWDGYLRVRRSPLSSLFVVCVAIFTDMLVYGMVVPIFVPEILGITTVEIGVLFAMYAAGLLIATPIFGILSDRFGRKWPMLAGLIGLGAATTILAFIKFFPFMALARCFQGIAAASTWVTGLALVADTFPTEQLGWAMGMVMSVCQVGILIGPTFGGFVYEFGGYRLPFIIASGVAVFDGVLRILLVSDNMPSWKEKKTGVKNTKNSDRKNVNPAVAVGSYSSKEVQRQYLLNPDECETEYEDIESCPEPNGAQDDQQPTIPGSQSQETTSSPTATTPLLIAVEKQKDSSDKQSNAQETPISMWDLVQNRSILMTSVVVLLASNALTVLEPTLPVHLEHVLDASPMLIGLVFMCESLVDMIASPFVGWCCDRVGNKPLMIAGMLLAGLVMPVVALPTEWWQQFPAVAAMAVCNALMLTPTLPELAIQVDAMGGGAYGQVYAIYNFFYSLGMLGGPLVGSILSDHLGLFLTMVAFGGVVSLFSPFLIFAYLFSRSPKASPIDTSPALEGGASPIEEEATSISNQADTSASTSATASAARAGDSGQPPVPAVADTERSPLLSLNV